MASLFFPQLTSGSLAQYPIRRVHATRSIMNILPDGTTIVSPDPDAQQMIWQLAYSGLSQMEVGALQALFAATNGPFRAFTFIDPTGNMLSNSIDLTQSTWQASNSVTIKSGIADANGGTAGLVLTNQSQAYQEITQTLVVPANYQYCFSLYAASNLPAELILARRGSSVQASDGLPVGPGWQRIVSSGRLNDAGTQLSVAIGLAAGQQVQVFGPQLEPQLAPSFYAATTQVGGVFPNAHWAANELTVTAEGPDSYSTVVSIETAI